MHHRRLLVVYHQRSISRLASIRRHSYINTEQSKHSTKIHLVRNGRRLFATASATLSGVAAVIYQRRHAATTTQMEDDKQKKPDDEKDNDESSFFDITNLWSQKQGKGKRSPKEFWDKIFAGDEKESNRKEDSTKKVKEKDDGGIFSTVVDLITGGDGDGDDETDDMKKRKKAPDESISKSFLKLITGQSGKKEKTVTDIVAAVRDRSGQGDVEESSSFFEIFDMLNKYKDSLGDVVNKFMGDIDFSRLTPTAVLYFLEYEDEVKNPSWKRRMHRFCRGIDMSEVDELYNALILGELSYADTVAEIKKGLERHPTPYELVYCEVRSQPGKPAHFLAVQRDQPDDFFGRSSLRVTMVVRGTKSVADALTDLLCDTEDYKGGKAHSFILSSGRYITEKHHDLLLDLLESSGKSTIELTIIGHSLGAATASICGYEINSMNDPRLQARVVGFGCPALVSKDLAEESADYITTVVNDADVVPRLSGITVANLLLDILEFDWLPYAKTDIRHALSELQKKQPMIFNQDVVDKVTEVVEPLLQGVLNDTILEEEEERLEVELFPPGKCIHFYRDGVGFSGCRVDNTFFSEIDVSRRMIDDHLFHSGYQKTLLEVVRENLGDHHYRFKEDESLDV